MSSTTLRRWELAWFEDASAIDFSAASWLPASVPGAVQSSPFGLGREELYRMENVRKVAWMAQKVWVYRTFFEAPAVAADAEAVLLFHGVDYLCEVRVNGQVACRHEGMFSQFAVPLDNLRPGPNELAVVLYPLKDFALKPAEHLKARFSNGWDWAPTLVTAGIWQDVELVVRKPLHVRHAWAQTHLSNVHRADCVVHVQLSQKVEFGRVEVALGSVRQSFAIVNSDHLRLSLRIDDPPLWWPNGMGAATMVDLTVKLDVPGRATDPFITRTALREVTRLPARGQKARDLPLQLVINGRKVFIRGANWVPTDCCFAEVDRDRYGLFLHQFAAAGFNLLRVWGGGLIEKDCFYDLADELGLMIMQEFPLACERPAVSQRFVELLDAEARQFVPRLNRHPSIVLWTGGNEHYSYWDDVDSGTAIMEISRKNVAAYPLMDERTHLRGIRPYDDVVLNHIASLLNELDGSRPYQPTSGMEGEGEPHGTWNWDPRLGDERMRDYSTLYDYWNAQHEHLYSEASVESIASRSAIGYVFQTATAALPKPEDPVWRFHKAFDACWKHDRSYFTNPRANLWLDLASVDALFGELNDLDDLIAASQWMQAEGARYIAEELRRKTPHACGLIWWGANEPWPNLAGNQLIDYFGEPRPALTYLANAFRPSILSLRYSNCVARSFKGELWVTHEGASPFDGRYTVALQHLPEGTCEEFAGSVHCSGDEPVFLAVLPYTRLHRGSRLMVTSRLYDAHDQIVHENRYLFASNEDVAPMRPFLPAIRSQMQGLNRPHQPVEKVAWASCPCVAGASRPCKPRARRP